MRVAMVFDSIILVSYAFMPIDQYELKLLISSLMCVVDFSTNYCGDLCLQILLSNTAMILVIVLSSSIAENE